MDTCYETKDKRDFFLIEMRKDSINEIISKNRTKVNLFFEKNENNIDQSQENYCPIQISDQKPEKIPTDENLFTNHTFQVDFKGK